MARHMDFDAARAESEAVPGDPLTFTLGGDTWEVRPNTSGALLMDFILAETVTDQLRAGKELLMASIEAGQTTRFQRMLRSGKAVAPIPRSTLEGQTVAELKAKAKDAKVKGYAKLGKESLVDALDGKTGGTPIPPPTMAQIDEVIAWLVRELIGRPTQP